ncbi:MAG: hypothetical protein KF760_04375 [Candidatus Eremiobacteraeota bacterium]|nr:hypothetical protein [Candidatus Eremiobacteraeota bacterium]MCW5867152.1 hypothetical protein [Candidatus Eremiobacteraeota bacterium]
MKNLKIVVLGLALFGLSACGGSDSNNFGAGAGTFTGTNTTNNTTNPPPAQGSFNFTFTTNGNANATALTNSGPLAGSTTATGSPTNRLQTIFAQNIINGQTILLRTLTSTVAKGSALAPGDVFTYDDNLVTPGAFADYTEQGQPVMKRWVSTGGTVTIDSISETTAEVTVTNLVLTPSLEGTNTASGQITINGTATLTF